MAGLLLLTTAAETDGRDCCTEFLEKPESEPDPPMPCEAVAPACGDG